MNNFDIKNEILNMVNTKGTLDNDDKNYFYSKYGEDAITNLILSMNEDEYSVIADSISVFLVSSKDENVNINQYYSEHFDNLDSMQLYFAEIASIPLLTPEEEYKLAIASKNNKEAYDTLVESNLRLVISIAKRYIGRGLSLEDLIQAGNLGLMKAIERFNPEMGYKLSTYAYWWISQSIRRDISNCGRTIRIPVHMAESLNKYTIMNRDYYKETGKNMDVKQIMERINVSLETAKYILILNENIVSLDVPVGDGDDRDTTLMEFIGDDSPSVEDIVVEKDMKQTLLKLLDNLDSRSANILKKRYGLDEEGHKTLCEVGKQYKLTRERIRQIEKRSIYKLRRYSKRDEYKGTLR